MRSGKVGRGNGASLSDSDSPWSEIGQEWVETPPVTAPRRRRSAAYVGEPPRQTLLRRTAYFFAHVWTLVPGTGPRVMRSDTAARDWTSAPWLVEAVSFLPSKGLVASLLCAVLGWGTVSWIVATRDPNEPYALLHFLGAVLFAVTLTSAPLFRSLALQSSASFAYRRAVWWHSLRQGMLAGGVVVATLALFALRLWVAPLGFALLLIAMLIETIILLVLWLRDRKRQP